MPDTHHLMPIVVGAPRSGTTLLRFMLDAHPDLAIPPETGFLRLGTRFKATQPGVREAFARAIVGYPPEAPGWQDFGVPEESFRDALQDLDPFSVSEGFRAFYRLYAARFGKPRWGDKTPLYCMEIETIRRTLPEVRFIHLIRDGRDSSLSLRGLWFSPGPRIETQATYWRKCVLRAREAGVGRSDYLEVRYEDLVRRPRDTIEQVCAFVDLDFRDEMVRPHLRSPDRLSEHRGRWRPDGTSLVTAEQRLQQQRRTMEPLDERCVFGWKSTMADEERARFRRVAGDLLEALGYEP
jgi:hypothetical protein